MLPDPTPHYIRQRLPDFEADPRYCDGDRAVALVFNLFPANRNVDQVLAKVSILNSLYSTWILNLHAVAQHIVNLDIDDRLASGDTSLVHEIANVTIGGKRRSNLSFASKYCSWHQPDQFQIFDSLVEELLWQYQAVNGFAAFKRGELRQYTRFMEIVDALVNHFGLNEFSRKDLDKFMWLEGRALQKALRSAFRVAN